MGNKSINKGSVKEARAMCYSYRDRQAEEEARRRREAEDLRRREEQARRTEKQKADKERKLVRA